MPESAAIGDIVSVFLGPITITQAIEKRIDLLGRWR
jgi:hypothetical protein